MGACLQIRCSTGPYIGVPALTHTGPYIHVPSLGNASWGQFPETFLANRRLLGFLTCRNKSSSSNFVVPEL